MATIAQLRQSVRDSMDCLVSEYAEPTMTDWVREALLEHNAGYESDGSDLPAKEEQLVKLLTMIKVCNARAAKAANQTDMRNQQGFAHDRSTPYYKNIDMATKLRRQYDDMCLKMGIAGASDDVNTVVVGRLSVVDSTIAARTPYLFDQTPIKAPVLSLLSKTATSAKIKWTVSKDETMLQYLIFGMENATIYDEANIESSTGVPRINDLADLHTTVYDPRDDAREFTGLTTGVPYHFLIVVKNAQNKYVYSNELTVTPE